MAGRVRKKETSPPCLQGAGRSARVLKTHQEESRKSLKVGRSELVDSVGDWKSGGSAEKGKLFGHGERLLGSRC